MNCTSGTDLGVFYRASNFEDWLPFSKGLPNTIVTGLDIHYQSQKIRASTLGRGVWESVLYDKAL